MRRVRTARACWWLRLMSATLLVAAALAPTTAGAAPGVPQPPRVLFVEGFENGTGATVALGSYVGAPPLGQSYTADPSWLDLWQCNGVILSSVGNVLSPCHPDAFPPIRDLAYALGTIAGAADPSVNRALAEYTLYVAPSAAGPMLRTVAPIPLPGGNRFVTVAVDAAAVNCGTDDPKLAFALVDGGALRPVTAAPVDVCSDRRTRAIPTPSGFFGVRGATFAADSSVLLNAASAGIELRDLTESGAGNDFAVDTIRLLDATPQLDKRFAPDSAPVGGTARMAFVVTNTSELAAKPGWRFTDALPAGLSLANPVDPVTDCPGATVDAPAGSATVGATGSLAAGQDSCTVAVSVTSPTEGTFTNQAANVSAVGLDPPADPASVHFGQADLAVAKQATRRVAPGGTVTTTLTVTNDGPDVARGVRLRDSGAPGIEADGVSAPCSLPLTGCELGDMAPGDTRTVTITGRATAEGLTGDTASVASDTPDPEPANDTASAATTVEPIADVSIAKSLSESSITRGETFQYLLRVENAGPSTARAVTVTDELPGGVELIAATSSRGDCDGSSPVVCRLGDLPDGASAEITLRVRATVAGAPRNGAVVSSPTFDPAVENNRDEAGGRVSEGADLAITKLVSAPTVLVDGAITYTLLVENRGPGDVARAVVGDRLPDGLRLSDVRTSRGSCSGDPLIVCKLGALANGARARIEIDATARAAVSHRNVAVVTSDGRDPDPDNNVYTAASAAVEAADLAIAKRASSDFAVAGQTVDYAITVTNRGPSQASGVAVTDAVLDTEKIVSADPSQGACQVDAVMVCGLGTIARGASATIDVRVRFGRTGASRNVAQVTSTTLDPVARNNIAETLVSALSPLTPEERPLPLLGVLPRTGNLVVGKRARDLVVRTGRLARFTVAVRNVGPRTARNVVVTDPIPGGLRRVRAETGSGRCATVRHAIVCRLGDIPARRTRRIAIRARTTRPGLVLNQAGAVAAAPTDVAAATNIARAIVAVVAPRAAPPPPPVTG